MPKFYFSNFSWSISLREKFNFSFEGNLLCLFVFNQKSVDLSPSFSNILKCLSLYDIALLVRVQTVKKKEFFMVKIYKNRSSRRQKKFSVVLCHICCKNIV